MFAAIKARADNKEVVKSYQRKLKNIWKNHIEVQKDPNNKFVYPGPGYYEGKHFIKDEPSFKTAKFQHAVRPMTFDQSSM